MVCNLRRHHVTVTARKNDRLVCLLTRWPGRAAAAAVSSSAFCSIQTFCTRAAAATPFFFFFHVVNRVIAAADANGATGATRVLLFNTNFVLQSKEKHLQRTRSRERGVVNVCTFVLPCPVKYLLRRRTDSFVYGAGV